MNKKILISISFTVFTFAFFTGIFFYRSIFSNSEYRSSIIIEIGQGESINSVTEKIIKAKISTNKFIVRMMLNRNANFDKIKYGEFSLPNEVSLYDAIKLLSKTPNIFHKITIIEGENSDDVANKINSDSNINNDTENPIGEGTLLPDTYCFAKYTSKSSLIKFIQKKQQEYIEREFQNKSELCTLNTKEDVIKLASIVEKESSILHEKQLIAYIYMQRLLKGMRLQSCPTALYKTNKSVLLINDTKVVNEYNTYRIKGLPITPICNPGRDSIYAVLHPIASNFLFFVSDKKGGNIFSSNFTDHKKVKQVVKKYQ